MVEIGSLSTLCFFRLSFGNAIIQEGTSQPEDTSTFAIFLKNGLSSSVKNVMASPDLPALPDRPTIDTYIIFFSIKVPPPDAMETVKIAHTLKDHLNLLAYQNSIKKEPNRQDDEVDVKGS